MSFVYGPCSRLTRMPFPPWLVDRWCPAEDDAAAEERPATEPPTPTRPRPASAAAGVACFSYCAVYTTYKEIFSSPNEPTPLVGIDYLSK